MNCHGATVSDRAQIRRKGTHANRMSDNLVLLRTQLAIHARDGPEMQ